MHRQHREPLLRRGIVDVHDADHVVLHVPDKLRVLRLEPAQVVDTLQRRGRAPRFVQPANERQQWPVERSLLRFVLLRVDVLLRPLAHRHVLEILEAGVDPVRGRQRRGEHEPRLECRTPAPL